MIGHEHKMTRRCMGGFDVDQQKLDFQKVPLYPIRLGGCRGAEAACVAASGAIPPGAATKPGGSGVAPSVPADQRSNVVSSSRMAP